MKWLLKGWSYVANPIFIPGLVSLWYFTTVSFSDPNETRLKMYLILILSAAIPLLLFIILKVVGAVSSIHLSAVQERITPLILYCILLLIIIRGVFTDGLHKPLYLFFIGVLMASMVSTVLSFARYKISLHMLAMGGMLGFVVMLSIHLGIPFLNTILVIVLLSGLTASSRLYLKAHVGHELWFGICVGFLSQVLIGSYITY